MNLCSTCSANKYSVLSFFFYFQIFTSFSHQLSSCLATSSGLMDKSAVLTLYRLILRYGKELKFTDQQYFATRIRQEFERTRNFDLPAASAAYKVFF